MKRFVCDKCKAPIRKRNIVCYSCGYANTHLIRKLRIAGILKATVAIVLIVGIIALCNSLMLLPWQWGARRNRDVILKYAEEHYPNAEFIESHYNSAQFFVWNNFRDCLSFELDGVEFNIIAEGGEVLADGYPKACAYKQFDKIIQDGFLKPREIAAQTEYSFSDNLYEIPYTGGLGVTLRIRDQGAAPREIGWLYDFYKYWKENADFLKSYSVYIDIVTGMERCAMRYNKSSDFADEEDFYAAFGKD